MIKRTNFLMMGAASMTAAALLASTAEADTISYDSILFVDSVLDFHRGLHAGNQRVQDPNAALGAPDHVGQSWNTSVSLGTGGWITLGFTGEEYLAVSGDENLDLLIWDSGAIHEQATVYVRPLDQVAHYLSNFDFDQDGFIEVGLTRTDTGLTGLDLDAVFGGFAFGQLLFDAVKIVDSELFQGMNNDAAGLDLDAVGAVTFAAWTPPVIFSALAPAAVPSPSAALAGLAMLTALGLRRRRTD